MQIKQIDKPDGPIVWNESLGAWAVWKYKDVSAILTDQRFSATSGNIKHQADTLPSIADPSAASERVVHSIQKQLSWASEQMQTIVATACEKLKDPGHFDLQKDLIVPSCNQLSIILTGTTSKTTETQLLHNYAQTVFLSTNTDNLPDAEKATMELSRYFLKLINQRRQTPSEDFVSLFAQSSYPVHVLLSPVIQMFVGLSTSLPLLLGNIMLTLLTHPQQTKQYLKAAKPTINELIRFAGPVQLVYRLTITDAKVGNHQFRRGDRIALILTHANRDSTMFSNPEKLDLDRNAVAHLSFGKGMHSCLGAPIIRKALEIIPHYILSQFPDMECNIANIKWGGSPTIQGITSIPVLTH